MYYTVFLIGRSKTITPDSHEQNISAYKSSYVKSLQKKWLFKSSGHHERASLPTSKQASDQWKALRAAATFLLVLATEETIRDASKTQAAE